ncbi:MAG TPA: VacJ family lipoprotein [Caulobacteraceae bacterium]|nr:VacJ family lipoprotein [Caulobacteraceae bacterium]
MRRRTQAALEDHRPLRNPRLFLCLVALLLGPSLAHAASREDPWEKINRKMFVLTVALARTVFAPVIAVYKLITPGPIGKGVHHALTNLDEPVVALNDMLQARPKAAVGAVVRLAFNTTVGIGGVIDVTAAHDPHHDNGFGLTMARWGIKPGPYLFVPVLGPSTVRDGIGLGVDVLTDPLFLASYPYKTTIGITRGVAGALDQQVEHESDLKTLLAGSADPYATLRSVYLQQRQSEIEGAPAVPVLPDIGEPAPPPPSASQ